MMWLYGSYLCLIFRLYLCLINYNYELFRREIKLTSVMSLRKEVENHCSETLQTIFLNHKYVGAASPTWSLFQHDTNLYICNSNNVL